MGLSCYFTVRCCLRVITLLVVGLVVCGWVCWLFVLCGFVWLVQCCCVLGLFEFACGVLIYCGCLWVLVGFVWCEWFHLVC